MANSQMIFNDCSAGMITKVKAELCPQNSVDLALNMDVDDIYGEARDADRDRQAPR